MQLILNFLYTGEHLYSLLFRGRSDYHFRQFIVCGGFPGGVYALLGMGQPIQTL